MLATAPTTPKIMIATPAKTARRVIGIFGWSTHPSGNVPGVTSEADEESDTDEGDAVEGIGWPNSFGENVGTASRRGFGLVVSTLANPRPLWRNPNRVRFDENAKPANARF